jgi:dihydrofolate reductase
MKRLILQMQISVDGLVSSTTDPTGETWQIWNWGDDWRWDDDLKREFNGVFEAVDCILISRKMAEDGYVDHWTTAAKNHPHDPYYAFARRIVATEKVVATRTLKDSRWDRTRLLTSPFVEGVTQLKMAADGDIIAFGGVTLASSLIAERLVDEIQFYVNPSAIGDGRSIFKQRGLLAFRLDHSRAFACGIVVNKFVPLYR